jgi:hypothetical protein
MESLAELGASIGAVLPGFSLMRCLAQQNASIAHRRQEGREVPAKPEDQASVPASGNEWQDESSRFN